MASTNVSFIERHKEGCTQGTSNSYTEVSHEGLVVEQVIRPRRYLFNYDQMVRCVAEVSGVRTKLIVLHLRHGKFRILRTSLYDYRNVIGRVIDASDICEVIL